MDDDPVLRALGAALERDDPGLAALLRAGPAPAVRPAVAIPTPRSPERTPPAPTKPPAPATPPPVRRRRRLFGWVLALGGVLATGLVVLATIRMGLAVLGVIAMVLLLASPVAACWWYASADELRPPDG